MILLNAETASVAMVADVTGNTEQAEALLAKVAQSLIEEGATKRTVPGIEGSGPLTVFDLPPIEGDTPGAKRLAVYCLEGNLLAASDNVEVLRDILRRNAGGGTESLAGDAAMRSVDRWLDVLKLRFDATGVLVPVVKTADARDVGIVPPPALGAARPADP